MVKFEKKKDHYKIKSQDITFLRNKKQIFSNNTTHVTDKYNNSFTSEKLTLGAIYVVRDPRNVLSSLKNHYNFNDYNEAFDFMTNKKKYICDVRKKDDFSGFQFLGSWSDHYKSWVNNSKFKTLLLSIDPFE